MHYIQEEIGIPRIKIERISGSGSNSGSGSGAATGSHAVFSVSPLPTGYGSTLGNAFRRVLLSSLPGAAITGVKIDGITHEYSSVKGVKDSVLDITLNLKNIRFKKLSKEVSFATLKITKEGPVHAKDIECPSDIEVLNPDAYITTVEKGGKLNMELRIEKGVGYVPAAVKQKQDNDAEIIVIDAIYSPVLKVRFDVEATRIGQMTNLDKLILEVQTDGSITAEESVKFASNLLQSYFSLFNEDQAIIEEDFTSDFKKISEKQQQEEKSKPSQEAYTPIEILGFSPRTLNALINGGIGSVEQLTKCTVSKLTNLRGFGKKALTEVVDALKTRNLTLADE